MTMTVRQACEKAGVDVCTFWKMQQEGVLRSFPASRVVVQEIIDALPEYRWRKKYGGDYSPLQKTCKNCGVTKSIEDFRRGKSKSAKYGYLIQHRCRRCEYRSKSGRSKSSHDYKMAWAAKPENRARRRDAERERRKNPKVRLDLRIGKAVRAAVGGGSGWRDVLPYSADELCLHLEKQFLPGMSWENMSEWHIDHIIPKSAFNYSSVDDESFLSCWGLPNLRPAWAKDNISKGAKREFLL